MSTRLRPFATALLLALVTLGYYSVDLRRDPIGPDEARILSAAQQERPGLPLVVNVGGDRWVQPLGFYATVVTHRIAPGFFAGRRASIVVAAINVGAIFLVAWRIFGRYLPAIVAAIILMFTPAHYAFGRLGTDAIYIIPFILGWLYGVASFVENDRPSAIALASASLGVGVYSTPSAPLTMAFLWVAMIVALWAARRRKVSTLGSAAAGFAAALVPLAAWLFLHPQQYADTYGRWAIFAAHLRNPLDGVRAFVNLNTLGTRASAYWGTIDPSYLFFAGPSGPSPLLIVSVPLIIAGIVRCARLAPKPAAMLVLSGALIAPLAGSSFGETHYIGLALGLLAFVALLCAYGIDLIRDLIVPPPPPPPVEES